MMRFLSAVAWLVGANGIMFNQKPETGTCGSATGSAWSYLESQFQVLGYPHYHCLAQSGTYCQRLAALGPLNIEELSLPMNSRILFYGHSYTRELHENMLLANAHLITKAEDLTWTNWEAGPPEFGKFVGCGDEAQGFPVLRESTFVDVVGKINTVGNSGVFTFGALNTTIVTVENYAPLQSPTCMGQLDRFLGMNKFDAVVFMRPHGKAFDQYQAQMAAGLRDPAKPVDLATMTTIGDVLDYTFLAEKFRLFSPLTIFVEPWTENGVATPGRDDAIAHSDTAVFLNNYVFTGANALCCYPECDAAPKTDNHQCNPGTLTLAARDVRNILHARPNARG
eukprot:TRINITY_DN63645_c0_g1_i1.p1 TRINITY_DN63645_c0_g1~~TRINITY_DN63645_c0_g1_i1.p1  ORF type:complete len:338 (-),score=31.88 TRINITY_DN63645_c0_g1_i1:89-1102(-)